MLGKKFMLFKVYLRQSVGMSSRPKPSKSVRPYWGSKWCKQCEGSRIRLNNDSSWSSMISNMLGMVLASPRRLALRARASTRVMSMAVSWPATAGRA